MTTNAKSTVYTHLRTLPEDVRECTEAQLHRTVELARQDILDYAEHGSLALLANRVRIAEVAQNELDRRFAETINSIFN